MRTGECSICLVLDLSQVKYFKSVYADMAELADALASGASPRKGVKVQVLLSAPLFQEKFSLVGNFSFL